MGQQIIKQPDGQFAVFSSITDTIIFWDATALEVENWFAEQAAADARRTVRTKLEHIQADNPREAYYQFAMSWDEALEMDREHGGEVWREFEQG